MVRRGPSSRHDARAGSPRARRRRADDAGRAGRRALPAAALLGPGRSAGRRSPSPRRRCCSATCTARSSSGASSIGHRGAHDPRRGPGRVRRRLARGQLPEWVLHVLLVGLTALSIARALRWLRFDVPRWRLGPAGLVIGAMTGTSGGAGVLFAPVLLSTGLRGTAFVGDDRDGRLCHARSDASSPTRRPASSPASSRSPSSSSPSRSRVGQCARGARAGTIVGRGDDAPRVWGAGRVRGRFAARRRRAVRSAAADRAP